MSRAEFYRAHRAELAIKIRTGLVGLNAASALGIATLYGAISRIALSEAGVGTETLAVAFFCFSVGAWLGGWALNAQYVDAINGEGDATTRAQVRSRAIDGMATPASNATSAALDQLKEIPFIRGGHDQLAINLQSWSWGTWGTGILALALSVAWHTFGAEVLSFVSAAGQFLARWSATCT